MELLDCVSVQKWLAEPPGRGFQPVREDPAQKQGILTSFCS